MKWESAAATDIGRRRSQNQDHFFCDNTLALFLVADGMGGHKGGETASQVASELIPHHFRQNRDPSALPTNRFRQAIAEANRKIFELSNQNHQLSGMGTTATGLHLHFNPDEKLIATIGHVGDSRCYLFQKQGPRAGFWLLTRDHSLVQEKLRAGLISREEAAADPNKNFITRSVGFEPNVPIDTYQLEAHPGFEFLICSDGLSNHLEDMRMYSILSEDTPGSARLQKLIDTANAEGGDDNITGILIHIL